MHLGLDDLPRPGKPSPLPEALRDRVLELTLTAPPTQFGATHWSSRLLAAALAAEGTPISHATIARIWHRFGVQPWRAGTFKFFTDPQLEGTIRDVVGLYLHPPDKAVVLCVDEKPQLQALERTAPTLPVAPGSPSEPPLTTSGTAPPRCSPPSRSHRPGHRRLHRAPSPPGVPDLSPAGRPCLSAPPAACRGRHLATHKHPVVRGWLARHPRVHLHFTPISESWLNLMEAFFSIISRQALRRGSFPTVADLIAAIERFFAAWNDRCRPFTWTKDPDTVIAKATQPRHRKAPTTSDTEH